MNAPYYLALALMVPLLVACKPEPVPAKVVPESAPAASEHAPVTPRAKPELPVQREAAPVPGPNPPVTQATSRPAAKAPAEVPKTKLDLSLPAELAEQLNAEDHGADTALTPLLPPLFEPKRAAENPFQLSGRLLTNDDNKDYWDSVEGAELQFEFKR